jgi:hypothetical protein
VDPTSVAASGAVRNLSSLRRSVGAEVAPDTVCTSMVAIMHEGTALGLRTVASAEQMEVAVGGQQYVAFFWYSRCMALLCQCLKEWCALESQAEADVPGFGERAESYYRRLLVASAAGDERHNTLGIYSQEAMFAAAPLVV